MDRYTKFVLTVIAACLMWLCLISGGLVSGLGAAYTDTKIEIADVSVGRHRALPVYVTGELTCKD